MESCGGADEHRLLSEAPQYDLPCRGNKEDPNTTTPHLIAKSLQDYCTIMNTVQKIITLGIVRPALFRRPRPYSYYWFCYSTSWPCLISLAIKLAIAIFLISLLPAKSSAAPSSGGGPEGGGSQSQRKPYRKTDYGALIIDNTNYDDSIHRFKFLAVLFYAPWCPHSQNFLRHYRRITKTLKEKKANVVIAEVDGSSDAGSPLIASESIEFYPTLMLFRNGARIKYDGHKTDSRVLLWIEELTMPKMKTLHSLKQATDLLAKEQNVIMGFAKGEGTWARELFEDGTIGTHDEFVRAFIELPPDDPAANELPINGNETMILLRKSTNKGGQKVDWAKIPISLLTERRKTAIIQFPGASMGQQGAPSGGGGGGGGQYPEEMGGAPPEGMGEGQGQGQGQGEGNGGWFSVPAGAIDQKMIQGGEQGGGGVGGEGGNGWFNVPAGAINQNMIQGGEPQQMPGGQQ